MSLSISIFSRMALLDQYQFLSKIYFLPKIPDIDISKNVLSDMDMSMKVLIAIDIFKSVPIDINIFKNGLVDIDIIKNCRYIDDGYG